MQQDIPMELVGRDVIQGKIVFDKIILISNRKKPKKHCYKYLQIQLFKVPIKKTINETSSEKIKPTITDFNDISFQVSKEDRDTFHLQFRKDLWPDDDQYEIHLQVRKKDKTKVAGTFGICYNDMEPDSFKKKMRNRHLESNLKSVDQIEIKYKVYSCEKAAPPAPVSEGGDAGASLPPGSVIGPDQPDLGVLTTPHFEPNSCILVVGTTGRGKTTTMNLFTGNTAATKGASHSTTMKNSIYQDLQHPGYPLWLDTVGLDEADAQTNNSELVRSYLISLQAAKVKWVHAVVWCITPEGKGALATISDIEGGHQDIVSSVQCLQYDLDFGDPQSLDNARSMLHQALANISSPMQVMFNNSVCRDCGQKGDERLLSDLCHENKVEMDREWFSRILPKKTFCSNCKKNWTKKILGVWSYTNGRPCVRIRNHRDIRGGETLSKTKTRHNMVECKPLFSCR